VDIILTHDSQRILLLITGFLLVSLASRNIGYLFTKFKLPLITGFLFTGILAGPFILNIISESAVESLRFIDEISLAFIAFAAGGELYIKELKSRLKSIKWVTTGLVICTFSVGTATVYLLANYIPFMHEMPNAGRLAVSLLAGAILVARSPSSAIAIIKELRAKGPFTQTVLGVTVIMDVVVIVIFSISSPIADVLLVNLELDIGFILILFVELLLSLVLGYLVSKIIQFIISRHLHSYLKTCGILLTGYGVFLLSRFIRSYSHHHFSFEIFIEPLLICLIGSFIVSNFTNYRGEFLKLLRDVEAPVYILFFTLTGASLNLSILSDIWMITCVLFFIRLGSLFIGAFTGGMIAGDPMKHNRIAWMSYITQAGVGLGLAKQVAVEFPEWGISFATMIISVIVVNQIVGPAFFKWALNLVNEGQPLAKKSDAHAVHNVIIFGSGGQALALARQLHLHNWQVKMAFKPTEFTGELVCQDIALYNLKAYSLEELQRIDAGEAGTFVTMLSDSENLEICEIASKHFTGINLVSHIKDRTHIEEFRKYDVFTVCSATAIVSLLDHVVRAPSAVSVLLGLADNQAVIDIEISNPDIDGIALRDLRLPYDILFLSIHRKKQMLEAHGNLRFRLGDKVTVIGSLQSLEEVSLRLSG